MARYWIVWEGDTSRLPVDMKERGHAYKKALAMVKEDLDSGILKEWGKITGSLKGIWIAEGSEKEVALMMEKYKPFFSFPEIFPIINYDQAIDFTDELVK